MGYTPVAKLAWGTTRNVWLTVHKAAIEAFTKVLGAEPGRAVTYKGYMVELQRQWMAKWYAQLEVDPDPDVSELYASTEYAILSAHCYLYVTMPTCGNLADFLEDTRLAKEVGGGDEDVVGGTQILSSIAMAWDGVGLATAHMALAIPTCTWIYHNAPGLQANIAAEVFRILGLKNVRMVEEPPSSADGVCWFECMEHFRNPIAEADRWIFPGTRMIMDCSSFAYDGVGHYVSFLDQDGVAWPRNIFRRKFNENLRHVHRFEDGAKFFGMDKYWQSRPLLFWRELE